MRSEQEKQKEGVIPNTSQAHCSNTAIYLYPNPLPHTPPGNRLSDTWRKPIVACATSAIKHSLYFYYKHQKQRAPWLCETTAHLPVESLCPLAWHYISPCLLIGLGIYCNAIVLDGIGLVLTLMMPSSLNLESLLLCGRPCCVWGWACMEEGVDSKGRTHTIHLSDPVKIN